MSQSALVRQLPAQLKLTQTLCVAAQSLSTWQLPAGMIVAPCVERQGPGYRPGYEKGEHREIERSCHASGGENAQREPDGQQDDCPGPPHERLIRT